MKTTASVTNTFVYDGWLLLQEQSASGGNLTINHYVWGLDLSGSLQGAGGVGGLLAVATTANDMSAIALATADANGNITEYVDGGGSIVARYEYDAFGNEITRRGAEAP